MSGPVNTRKRAIILLAALLGASALGGGRPRPAGRAVRPKDWFLAAKVPAFQIRNQTLLDGILQLARGPAPFGFGFERPLRAKSAAPPVPPPRLSLRLAGRTVRQILDALCQADPRFTWSIDGTTVNVFPRGTTGDATYLLNRRIKNFVLRDATNVDDGLLAISRELPPPTEQIAHVQAGGSDPYPQKPWTVTFRRLTVRQIVNRLAAHGGACAFWTFGGSADFRFFGFFNTNLC